MSILSDKQFYYIALNTPTHTVQLDIYNSYSEAEKYMDLMVRDKDGTQASFIGLQSIPIEEFASLSIIKVRERYGHQIEHNCVKTKAFI